MKDYEFIGRCLYIGKLNCLVLGDLHLGFEESLRESGVMLPMDLFKEVILELERVFDDLKDKKIEKLDKVILLGDVKHEFGRISMEDRRELGELFNFLRSKCGEVLVVKGNHDSVIGGLVSDLERVKIEDYFIIDGYCFIHGDKDFPQIHEKSFVMWLVGHAHPAIYLDDGSKKEKYKCFLSGKYKDKKVVIMPSFFDVNEGTDPREYGLGLAWDFKLNDFKVWIVDDDSLDALDFGKLRNI